MKIAITGHSNGIGKAFAEQLTARGHSIVGISRRDGENIRRVPHTASLVEDCDLFINNAQTQYAQTELLYEVWNRWQGKEKYIWNISTMMVEEPVNGMPDGQDDLLMSQYRNQKIALEEATRQLRHKNNWPQLSIIRPGGVATQKKFDNTGKADVNKWVKSVIDTFAHNDNILISEISIGHTKKRIPI
jgi:NAD(P)-dependent dehydrogenase (short-subunit alcohol dehydrogenase family)